MRRLFTIISALAMVLCVGSCIVWARSERVYDLFQFSSRYAVLDIGIGHDDLFASQTVLLDKSSPGYSLPPISHWVYGPISSAGFDEDEQGSSWETYRQRSWGGFIWRENADDSETLVELPFWALPLVFGLCSAPFIIALSRRVARKNKRGKCPHCGYDLRATPGQCPECGFKVTPRAEDRKK